MSSINNDPRDYIGSRWYVSRKIESQMLKRALEQSFEGKIPKLEELKPSTYCSLKGRMWKIIEEKHQTKYNPT